uniref:Uncharacterized protein n=1 Tax=Sinocyclocheilus grahami TaxID=75366 RepID=A0A672PSZ1_SINGR
MRFKDGQIPCEVNSDTSADISHVCDIAADPLVKSLRLHSDAVLCLASDDQYILSGSKDQTIALFDRRAGKLLQKVQVSELSYSAREVTLMVLSTHAPLTALSRSVSCQIKMSLADLHPRSWAAHISYWMQVYLPCAPPKTLCTLHHQAGVNGVC